MGKFHPSLDVGTCMIHPSTLAFSFNWSGESQIEGILNLKHSLDQPQDARTSKQDSYRLVPELHTKFWALAASFHRELELARADFRPRGWGLPGGGTPEARHSKVTEAFSRTALLTGPGSMLGGTRGLQRDTPLGGCGFWAATIPDTLCLSWFLLKGSSDKAHILGAGSLPLEKPQI